MENYTDNGRKNQINTVEQSSNQNEEEEENKNNIQDQKEILIKVSTDQKEILMMKWQKV